MKKYLYDSINRTCNINKIFKLQYRNSNSYFPQLIFYTKTPCNEVIDEW